MKLPSRFLKLAVLGILAILALVVAASVFLYTTRPGGWAFYNRVGPVDSEKMGISKNFATTQTWPVKSNPPATVSGAFEGRIDGERNVTFGFNATAAFQVRLTLSDLATGANLILSCRTGAEKVETASAAFGRLTSMSAEHTCVFELVSTKTIDNPRGTTANWEVSTTDPTVASYLLTFQATAIPS